VEKESAGNERQQSFGDVPEPAKAEKGEIKAVYMGIRKNPLQAERQHCGAKKCEALHCTAQHGQFGGHLFKSSSPSEKSGVRGECRTQSDE